MNLQLKFPPHAMRLALIALSTLAAIFYFGDGSLLAQSDTTSQSGGTPLSVQWGKASCYSIKRTGKLTASGELYHSNDFTAAHRTLPFNTMVRVTNLKNGQSVIVRINDRGPYRKGRILDLSTSAAGKIHMIASGIVPVKLEVLKGAQKAGSP